jgi:hypothetical protein
MPIMATATAVNKTNLSFFIMIDYKYEQIYIFEVIDPGAGSV